MNKLAKWAVNVLVSLDQLAATVFLGGDPDETISSRLGKLKRSHGGVIPWSLPHARLLDLFLDWVDPNHSIDAIEDDEGSDAIR
jgi:hypothetical protein